MAIGVRATSILSRPSLDQHTCRRQQKSELAHDQGGANPVGRPEPGVVAGAVHHKGDEAEPEQNTHAPDVVMVVSPLVTMLPHGTNPCRMA